jgi:RNA polymerase sigma-70 factor (ECF subfamily)
MGTAGSRSGAGSVPADEASAIAACQRGDRQAFELIVKRYAARALGAARCLVPDASLAEDAAQEAFVRAFRAIRRFRPGEPFYPWLYTILRNSCLTTLKRRGKPLPSLDTEDAPPPVAPPTAPAATLARDELRAAVREGMEQLSAPHREILHLAHFEGLSYKEIAVCLGVPIGTVMSRLWAARQSLRKVLAPRMAGHE